MRAGQTLWSPLEVPVALQVAPNSLTGTQTKGQAFAVGS